MKLVSAAVAVIACALAGCSSTPISNSEARAVAQDSLLSSAYAENRQGTTLVTVKRDSGLVGSGCSTRIFVNAAPIADLRPSQKVDLYLMAGDYMIGAKICGLSMSEQKTTVKAGEPQTYRVSMDASGNFALSPTAF